MEYRDAYVARIKRKTYDIISANTAFYGFIGRRIYARFNEIVVARYRTQFDLYAQIGGSVLVTLKAEKGDNVNCLAILSPVDEGITEVRMILLDNLQEWEKENACRVKKKNALLSLYGDYFIEYDVKEDGIRLYATDVVEQNIIQLSFQQFTERMESVMSDENRSEIQRMITAFREGAEIFSVSVPGDIFQLKGKEFTQITGKSLYENDQHVYSVAYVRLSSQEQKDGGEAVHALERDYLTGVLTKGEITNLAVTMVDVKKMQNVSLAIIDIDYFKKVNDNFGHMMGDEVLKRVAGVIQREVQGYGLVGRFGGDEFLLMLYDAYDMEAKREVFKSIKNTVAALNITADNGEQVNLTLSIGCAAYPKDADNYEDLFYLADFALYRAKEKGRNRYIIYDSEKHGTLEEIRKNKTSVNNLDSHYVLSPAEFVCNLQDKIYYGQKFSLQKLLDDVSLNLNIQRVMLYSLDPCRLVLAGGGNRLSGKIIEETQDYILSDTLQQFRDDFGMVAIANVKRFETLDPKLYNQLQKQRIVSLLHVPFCDRDGRNAILSLEYTDKIMTWNKSHFLYYRLLTRVLGKYSLDETE